MVFREVGKKAKYKCTNEILPAIVHGLDIREGDNVLSVCGAGCQAFAFSEFANKVVALDNSEAQVCLAEDRAKNLEGGDFSEFFYFGEYPWKHRVVGYFDDARLDRISARLDRVSFENGSVFERKNIGSFNKVYLSNICTYNGQVDVSNEWFSGQAQNLSVGTLVYLCAIRDTMFFPSFVVDSALTEGARALSLGSWKSVVLRKVV